MSEIAREVIHPDRMPGLNSIIEVDGKLYRVFHIILSMEYSGYRATLVSKPEEILE